MCSLGTIANCKIARLNLGSLVKISVKCAPAELLDMSFGSLTRCACLSRSVESLSESLTSLREIKIGELHVLPGGRFGGIYKVSCAGGAWYVQSSDRIDARARLLNPSVRLVRHDPETDEEREKMLTQFGA